jgi:hypothetical protein
MQSLYLTHQQRHFLFQYRQPLLLLYRWNWNQALNQSLKANHLLPRHHRHFVHPNHHQQQLNNLQIQMIKG